ncbi:hypothetical protein N7489_004765 [Penicillium chrysogenum]|uniref:uncharacterized protein n=1 Tax=Penicillium chrysogenum TaxID=5076 RepID=UPI0024DF1467|nr:uncharacterized protein N7489_004765 [Penicillium chrysogenum]KAJ5244669.1 hypothetical protein N7489_004765 [Penicillium chrysogenum]KAJ5849049.1 hypothetical protein N7534_008367 [Penicillium rubens]KAJ5849395.1 hypothetical protein N7534_008084 [Penicillium rubens]KAJ5858260.1 hypothetical protein N7534_003537 [Penicillium rubens]
MRRQAAGCVSKSHVVSGSRAPTWSDALAGPADRGEESVKAGGRRVGVRIKAISGEYGLGDLLEHRIQLDMRR